MATWPRHVISLVISTNDIPLNLSIVLTYHFLPDGFFFDILNSIYLLLGIGFLILHYWEAYQPLSYLLGSAFSVILLQFQFLITNILFVGTQPFFIRICWDLDHPTKSCNWEKLTKQNQCRIALVLGRRDSSSKRRCQALRNFCDKAKDVRHAGRSKTLLFSIFSTPLQEKLVPPISL